MVPMSGNLSLLFVVSETCKQSSLEDRWCQAICFCFPKRVNNQLVGQVVLMSSNLPLLFLVSERQKHSSWQDRWCLCQAARPHCFLFPKNVNEAAGRTGGAYVKQLVLVVFRIRNMKTKQPGGQVVPMSSNLSSLFVVSETCKQSNREDSLCLCQAICPCCLLFPKHVNGTGAYVKHFVLVPFCLRNM